MSSEGDKPSKAPSSKMVIKPSSSGQHPAVQGYRKKLESIADGVGVATDVLDQKLSELLSDMKSSRPPPSDETKSEAKKEEVKTFSFIVILQGVFEQDTEMENRLYEAGLNDALLHSSQGVVALDFDRQDTSLEHAKLTALEDIARAGYTVSRVIDSD